METQPVRIKALHLEHIVWRNEMKFYQEEIGLFETHLGEIAVVESDRSVKAQIEHFQNQFIRHREVIDEMVHDMNVHEQELAHTAAAQSFAVYRDDFRDHEKMRENMVQFRRIYNELKHSFLLFVSALK